MYDGLKNLGALKEDIVVFILDYMVKLGLILWVIVGD